MNTLQTEQCVHNDDTLTEGSPALPGHCSVSQSFLKHMATLKKLATQKEANHVTILKNVLFPFPKLPFILVLLISYFCKLLKALSLLVNNASKLVVKSIPLFCASVIPFKIA